MNGHYNVQPNVGGSNTTHKVLKLGGSLIETAHNLIDNLLQHEIDVLIVPGGGPFADAVRIHTRRISSDAAHWMAVLAMNQYGFYLAGGTDCRLIDKLVDIPRGVSILLPFRIIYKTDPVPHSWDATSDSVAGWIAAELHTDLVVAKAVDGIYINNGLVKNIRASELDFETCIDTTLPKLISKYKLKCTVINGAYVERVIAALYDNDVVGTKVIA